MNIAVVFFFLHNVIATFLLGMKFKAQKDNVFKFFGFALLLDAVAFAVWSFGVVRPDNLLTSITIGAVIFLISLVFFLYSAVQQNQPSTRKLLIGLGVLVVLGIFYLGNISPNTAYISPEGFLFFNLSPMVQMLYVFGLMLAALPAIDLVASKFKTSYASLIRYGFIAEIAGGIILITNKDANVLYLTGWIIGLVYLILWVTFLSKKPWSQTIS